MTFNTLKRAISTTLKLIYTIAFLGAFTLSFTQHYRSQGQTMAFFSSVSRAADRDSLAQPRPDTSVDKSLSGVKGYSLLAVFLAAAGAFPLSRKLTRRLDKYD